MVRNFLPINNVATCSFVLQRFLLHCVFCFGTEFVITSLIPIPMDMTKVMLNSVKKRTINLSSTRGQGCKIIHSSSCELIVCDGAVHKGWWYNSTRYYRRCSRHWRQPKRINRLASEYCVSGDQPRETLRQVWATWPP
jgi:hypothetical protein